MGGQDLDNSRNQPESGINKDNVARLKAKWVFTTGGDVSATPAVANGIVYFPDLAGNFYAVDAATGAQVWQAKVSDWTGVPGDFARNDPVIQGNLVILGDQAGSLATWDGQKINGAGAHIIAVNARTGKLVWVSQVDQFPTTQVTSSPVVHDGVLYVGVAANEFFPAIQGVPCCVSRGSVVALDMQTGRKIWQTYMVPDNNGNLGGYSGGGVWSSTPVIDLKRDAIYVGTGNNLSVPKSVEQCHQSDPNNRFCADASDHSDSVVALDLTSGKIKWAMRKVNYDVWNVNCDASFAAGPVPGSGALSGVRPGPGPNCPSPHQRRRRGRFCRFDGRQSQQPDHVRLGRQQRKDSLVVCRWEFSHCGSGNRRRLPLLGCRLRPHGAHYWNAQQQIIRVLGRSCEQPVIRSAERCESKV
jgi:polyvinyl alcohol dehydrogenase (cytochrome)